MVRGVGGAGGVATAGSRWTHSVRRRSETARSSRERIAVARLGAGHLGGVAIDAARPAVAAGRLDVRHGRHLSWRRRRSRMARRSVCLPSCGIAKRSWAQRGRRVRICGSVTAPASAAQASVSKLEDYGNHYPKGGGRGLVTRATNLWVRSFPTCAPSWQHRERHPGSVGWGGLCRIRRFLRQRDRRQRVEFRPRPPNGGWPENGL